MSNLNWLVCERCGKSKLNNETKWGSCLSCSVDDFFPILKGIFNQGDNCKYCGHDKVIKHRKVIEDPMHQPNEFNNPPTLIRLDIECVTCEKCLRTIKEYPFEYE